MQGHAHENIKEPEPFARALKKCEAAVAKARDDLKYLQQDRDSDPDSVASKKAFIAWLEDECLLLRFAHATFVKGDTIIINDHEEKILYAPWGSGSSTTTQAAATFVI